MTKRISCPEVVRIQLEGFARRGYPHEVCGVLLGTTPPRRILECAALPNLHRDTSATRFEMDPLAYARADREAAGRGRGVVGFFHSHPDHPAQPSMVDREFMKGWPGMSWVIVSVTQAGTTEVRSWQWDEASGGAVEEMMESLK